jgi:hypothetical protein
MRRIVVRLKQPTRHGDLEVTLFTNLPGRGEILSNLVYG